MCNLGGTCTVNENKIRHAVTSTFVIGLISAYRCVLQDPFNRAGEMRREMANRKRPSNAASAHYAKRPASLGVNVRQISARPSNYPITPARPAFLVFFSWFVVFFCVS